jgi:hypothetical protein
MTIEKKLLGISPSGDGPTDVAEVFSTYLYTGNAGVNAINNGIDLAGEGGLIWLKGRDAASSHTLHDTERGVNSRLSAQNTSAAATSGLTSFNSNGFTLSATQAGELTNASNAEYASFTFRKKSGFFDCVTYSGNGVAGREIAHGLDGPVGMLIVKCTSHAQNWAVWHKGIPNTHYLRLNSTNASNSGSTYWNNTTPTNTVFTVGTDHEVNVSGKTYVAYLFADNSSEDAEEQMIKCGSYSGTGNTTVNIDLGWEPQWIMVKRVDSNTDFLDYQSWIIQDTMRGLNPAPKESANGFSSLLLANKNVAEGYRGNGSGTANNQHQFLLTSNGFQAGPNGAVEFNRGSEAEYIYMAIRAPMMIEPTAATDVFNIDTAGANGDGVAPNYRSTFPVDFALHVRTGSGGPQAYSRLTGPRYLYTDSTNDEGSTSQSTWDFMNGWYNQNSSQSVSTGQVVNMWKRAKGFMDAVCYSGTGSARTVPHSLSVIPEMIWVKRRNGTNGWFVYTAEGAGSSYLHLEENYNYSTNATGFNNTAATSSVFSVGTNHSTNRVSGLYIAYLFATLDGISKCGTYTGNGSSQTINCGFSAGARFVLIKRANLAVSGNEGDWFMWDSVRGIVAGNDPHLSLNTTAAQVTNDDSVDPANVGFIVNQVAATNINVSSSTYIFYAIA